MLDYRAAQETKPKRPLAPKARRRLYPDLQRISKGLAAVKDRAKQLTNSRAKTVVPSWQASCDSEACRVKFHHVIVRERRGKRVPPTYNVNATIRKQA